MEVGGISAVVLLTVSAYQWTSVPLHIIFICAVLALILVGSRPPQRAEQFAPVYTSGSVVGLQYGVAAVQGRRPYMEDMYRVEDFEGEPAASAQQLLAFFGVFDGHGGKRAASWARSNLVSNLLLELTHARSKGKGDDGSHSPSDVLDDAAVDAFHRTDAAFLRNAAAQGIPDGSTAVTCMIQGVGPSQSVNGTSGGARSDRRLLVANLGDSRCVMVCATARTPNPPTPRPRTWCTRAPSERRR